MKIKIIEILISPKSAEERLITHVYHPHSNQKRYSSVLVCFLAILHSIHVVVHGGAFESQALCAGGAWVILSLVQQIVYLIKIS